MPVIELSGVTKSYRRTEALRDFSLTIPRGTALGFLGPNGAGKSTTIKLLMGLLRRDAGQVRVLCRDPLVDPLSVRLRVGYVPEQQFIYRWMRVYEAVAFCKSVFPRWDDRLCVHLLEMFDLDRDKKVAQLSKGMLTKLALLLALCHEPEVLILDEPMAGLDPIVREALLDGILEQINDRGLTVLLSSHSFADVQRLAERIAILHQGRLLVEASIDELITRTKRVRAVLRDGCQPRRLPDEAIFQRRHEREWLITLRDCSHEVVNALREANPLEHVEVLDIGLEEIFKDYVRGGSSRPC